MKLKFELDFSADKANWKQKAMSENVQNTLCSEEWWENLTRCDVFLNVILVNSKK
jgi:hypothetical protein